MPATEVRDACRFVSRRDGSLMEGGVGRMFERYDLKALVIAELHLRNTRDSLEVRMEVGLVGLSALWSFGLGGLPVLLFPFPYDLDVGSKCLWTTGVRACFCIK